MKEIWKDIKGFEGLYQVSNLGRVKSKFRKWVGGSKGEVYKPEMILKPFVNRRGYLIVDLRKPGGRKSIPIHRLVAIYFIPNPLNKATVNHKNGDKKDNRAISLEWNTQKENVVHSYKTGLKVNYRGAAHYRSKPVMVVHKNELRTISFANARYAAEYIGVACSSVWKFLNGVRNSKHFKLLYI